MLEVPEKEPGPTTPPRRFAPHRAPSGERGALLPQHQHPCPQILFLSGSELGEARRAESSWLSAAEQRLDWNGIPSQNAWTLGWAAQLHQQHTWPPAPWRVEKRLDCREAFAPGSRCQGSCGVFACWRLTLLGGQGWADCFTPAEPVPSEAASQQQGEPPPPYGARRIP